VPTFGIGIWTWIYLHYTRNLTQYYPRICWSDWSGIWKRAWYTILWESFESHVSWFQVQSFTTAQTCSVTLYSVTVSR
jgi:hypothetical protein